MENKTPSVHKVLATSYITYFMFCSLGLFLSIFFPIKFSIPNQALFGIISFGLGPLLIFWAQYTSYRFEIIKKQTGQIVFAKGPYRYFRNPTQIGLLFLVLGYAFVTKTLMLFIATFVSYLVSNFFFKKHEQILEDRYGEDYLKYKQKVNKVL